MSAKMQQGRPKARIVKVGIIDEEGTPQHWEFDCYGVVPLMELGNEGTFLAGYTIEELRAISKQQH
jgi:hypothetical protein